MKNWIKTHKFALTLIALVGICAPVAILAAGAIDRGPQRTCIVVQDGVGEAALVPPGGTARAVVEAFFFAGAADATTQTVSFISGGVTNSALTKTVSANDRLAAAANLPTLFAGDKLLITSSDNENTNKLPAYVIWKLID